MVLKVDSAKVIGYYYYEKFNAKILLSGCINGSQITLNESPDVGIGPDFVLGFIGQIDKNSISGVWKDVYQRKNLKFNIIVDKTCLLVSEDRAIDLIEGDYENEIGSLSLKHIYDKYFYFVVTTSTEDCVGYLENLIEFPDLKSGIYSSKICKELKMEVDSGLIKVSEKNCELHGMSCWFSGEYKKALKKSCP